METTRPSTPRRVVGAVLFVTILCATGSGAAAPPCPCAVAPETDGWCDLHRVGYVAAVRVPSRLLYDALDAHGHTLDLSTFTCPACREAIRTDGFCEKDAIGFVKRQAYFSRLTYELARGQRRDRSKIACKACRGHAEARGWCPRCGLGMVGNVEIRDRAAYDRAAHAAEILQRASDTVARCEWCAVAMATGTRCPRCRITYRDGKAVAPAVPAR